MRTRSSTRPGILRLIAVGAVAPALTLAVPASGTAQTAAPPGPRSQAMIMQLLARSEQRLMQVREDLEGIGLYGEVAQAGAAAEYALAASRRALIEMHMAARRERQGLPVQRISTQGSEAGTTRPAPSAAAGVPDSGRSQANAAPNAGPGTTGAATPESGHAEPGNAGAGAAPEAAAGASVAATPAPRQNESGPNAAAATPSALAPAGAVPSGEAANTLVAGITPEQADQYIGTEVTNPDGRKLGTLQRVVVAPDGKIRAAVLQFGGFLGLFTSQAAIDWQAAKPQVQNGHLVFAMTPDQVDRAPSNPDEVH